MSSGQANNIAVAQTCVGSPLPILYSFRRCPYAMRARLALLASGTACELREVSLAAKPAAMLTASAKATVPVLVLPDGQVIDESLRIMRWSLSRCDPDGWLLRDDPDLIALNDGAFKRDLDGYKYSHRDPTAAMDHRDSGLAWLYELDTRMVEGQLCGRLSGLVDMAIMPFVRQFAATDRAWFDAQPLPHLQRWLDGHLNSDLFAAIMPRHQPWKIGDDPIVFAKIGQTV